VGNLINGSHYTSGKVGMAGNFDGSSNYINGGSNNLPSGSAPRSAFMWVNFGAPTGEMGIFAYGTSGLTTQWSSLMRLTSGQLYFSGWQDDFGTSFHPPTNSWHFVGYVYVGGTSVAVYYDGQSQVGAISQSLSTTLTATSIIGGESSSGANSFNGQIDDVRIYNRALSASEVQALYNAEK
jgi:hypothetical protein